MLTITSAVREELQRQPLLQMMLASDLVNVRAMAQQIRPSIEKKIGFKVGLATIAIVLHRQAGNSCDISLESLLSLPKIILLTTYHDLVALNYPKGITGAETIPDGVRFFTQTTGSREHTIIISHENLSLLNPDRRLKIIMDLSALCLGLPQVASDIEGLYAKIFLFFGLRGVSIVEVVSTFNELTVIIKNQDYDKAYAVIKEVNAA